MARYLLLYQGDFSGNQEPPRDEEEAEVVRPFGALSRHHGRTNVPVSRLFTFAEGSAEVRVQCYLHTSDYAPPGWFARAERTGRLGRPVRLAR